MTTHFRVTYHFGISALNDPRSRWTLKVIKVPHIHVATTFASQISQCQAGFKLHAILRQVRQNDPKITLNTRRTKVPHIRVTTTPESQICLRFAIQLAVFKSGHFETRASNDPKLDIEHYKVKGTPYMCCKSTPKSQISPRFTLR